MTDAQTKTRQVKVTEVKGENVNVKMQNCGFIKESLISQCSGDARSGEGREGWNCWWADDDAVVLTWHWIEATVLVEEEWVRLSIGRKNYSKEEEENDIQR